MFSPLLPDPTKYSSRRRTSPERPNAYKYSSRAQNIHHAHKSWGWSGRSRMNVFVKYIKSENSSKIMNFHWFSLIFCYFWSFLMISHEADAPPLACPHPRDASPIIANRPQGCNKQSTIFPGVLGHSKPSSSRQTPDL